MIIGGLLGLPRRCDISALMRLRPTRDPRASTIPVLPRVSSPCWPRHGGAGVSLFIQQGGYLQFLMATVWDTSWLLPEGTMPGRLLHTLVGYTDQPNGLQLIVYVMVIVSITLLARWERTRHRQARALPSLRKVLYRS